MDPGHREASVIEAYLTEQMRGYEILSDTKGFSAHFTLVLGSKRHSVEVDEDFYMGRDAATIRGKLDEWQVADQIKNGARKIRIREEGYEVLEHYT